MFRKVPKNVFILGLVSLFNDIASEMVYPIIPIFLTVVLGVPVSIVGLIEGIAEATASIGKFFLAFGRIGWENEKFFVTLGYSFSAVSKLLIGLASVWPLVLFARFIDRTGKGLRTSARDSLLLQNATPQNKGFIFGFHKSNGFDGAVLGPLLALGLLYLFSNNYRLIFLLAFIPGVIAIILLVLFVAEKKENAVGKSLPKLDFTLLTRDKRFFYFFIVSMLFSLGNSSDSFLLLRAKNLGFSTTLVVLTYVLYNLSQTIFATPAGSLADKIGAKKVFAGGLLVFSLVYFLFGFISHPTLIWILFPVYGVYIAATDGVSKSYIAEFITEKESGTYFGLYQMGIALASFLASFIGGILWTIFGPQATFYYGSAMSLLAFCLLLFGRVTKKIE